MKKTILALAILLYIAQPSMAQTHVSIIGCQHEPTSYFNAATLTEVLNQCQPDVILMELDTNLMDNNGNFLRWAVTDRGNENLAVKDYKNMHGELVVRPFDIAGRSVYYANHNTFAMENRLWKSIDSLYHYQLLSNENMDKIAAYYKVNDTINQLSSKDVNVLNSAMYRGVAARRQNGQYNKTLEVVASTPSLKKYYAFFKDDGDFWIARNHAMIDNVMGYIKAFPGKNIIVLTGAMHTYFLIDGLEPLQHRDNFILMRLPEAKAH
jgi:hypothetical protein